MALRRIRKFGDGILRKKCTPVEKIDDKVLALLKDMAETMYHSEIGAGLAAPQVGIPKRVVVIDMGDGLINLINPEILFASGSREGIEGCLSIPGIYGKVIRPKIVKIKALNEKGEEFTITGEDDLAKCICHEIDHLNGILFTDKVIEYIDPRKSRPIKKS